MVAFVVFTCNGQDAPCHEALSKIIMPGAPEPPPGAFIPQCTDGGQFEYAQCHGSTGQCWCVNPNTGEEIEGTRKRDGFNPSECITGM